jgi:hypothetical protein
MVGPRDSPIPGFRTDRTADDPGPRPDSVETGGELVDQTGSAAFGVPNVRPPRRGWATGFALLVGLVLSGLVCSACDSGSSSSSDPVVPGGAALTSKAGSPAICSQLVQSAALRDLASDLTGLAQSPPSSQAVEGLRSTSDELRSLAAHAPGTALRADLTETASALAGLSAQGVESGSAITAVNNALTQLGMEVQSQCDFPVG